MVPKSSMGAEGRSEGLQKEFRNDRVRWGNGRMSKEDIVAIFGSEEVYNRRRLEIGIENRMGPMERRIKYESWRAKRGLITYIGEIERRA